MEIESFKDTETGPVYILGNGLSLDSFDFNGITCPTIGVNRSWKKIRSFFHFIPPADVYFKQLARKEWNASYIVTPGRIENIHEKINRFTHPMEDKIDCSNFVTINCDRDKKTEIFPNVSFTLSGVMAMHLAKYVGYTTLYLLGFDGGTVPHFKTDNPRDMLISGSNHDLIHEKLQYQWRNDNIKVYNCSKMSTIKVWPKMELSNKETKND